MKPDDFAKYGLITEAEAAATLLFLRRGLEACLTVDDPTFTELGPMTTIWVESLGEAVVEMDTSWLPIETAPHDGTPIWAYQRVNKRQVPMKWKQGAGYSMWVYDDEFLQDCLPDPEPPSHYRLLPEPPRETT